MKNSGQLSFNLGRPRNGQSETGPAHVEALYFAVLPDPGTAALSFELASDLRTQYGFSAKPRRPDLSHISLYRIGSYRGLPEEAAFAAMQAASTVRKRSFQVEFDRAVSFGGGDNRPLVLWNREGNAELKALHRELDEAMQLTGFANDHGEKFEPHMTLLYQGHLIPEVRLERPVSWTVRDFVLVNSLRGKAKHEHLCYWLLSD
ncbi:2'-5' RNA ligase family protein [Rhizobium rhizogenes]|uniref:2'-5' RNA ligase family protein n=1 Tax=Rhizobium rhizogenes TaxID=359 RepID=UPI000647C04E|nr:2'-5' RNA ligase family protein [Rhizobium rhizogenes]